MFPVKSLSTRKQPRAIRNDEDERDEGALQISPPLHPPFSNVTMSISYNSNENCPGRDYSLSQLLRAAKRKLQDTVFCERHVQKRNCAMSDF